MHITRIELENIKSYDAAAFEFGRGTTAIMGENGAGKTTLIEAVAWTLFDLLDYKKDDFLKRGTKRGVVRVEFESGLDERRYVVQRDTRTAYFVFDPKLNTRIADKKEEVTRFLWQHLGVEAGTDLESLFRRAIGVPQGTFTAIFLETPNERKKAFDKLLKVEEYRIGAMRLGRTSKHIEGQILEVVQKVARAEGELSNHDKYEKELLSISSSVKELDSSLKKLTKSVAKQRKSLAKLDGKKAEFEKLKAEHQLLFQEQKRAELITEQRRKELTNAEKAAEIVREKKESRDLHKKALGMLVEFERERKEREKLLAALTEVEKAILSVKAEQKAILAQVDEIESKRKAITELEPKAKEQENLEIEKKSLEESISKGREKEVRVKSLEKRLQDLRQRHKTNENDIKRLESRKSAAEEAEKLRSRSESITKEIAALRARIERDREFQVQIKDGMCPVFSAKCLNLKEGETLDSFLNEKFSGLSAELERLEKEQGKTEKSAILSREAQTAYSRLPLLEKRREEILIDGKELRNEQDVLNAEVAKLSANAKILGEIDNKLAALDNPRAKLKILKKDVGALPTLREKSTKVESNFERLESERRLKVEQLETYKNLDSNLKEYTLKRDQTIDAYNLFIRNEAAANSLSDFKKEMKDAESSREKLVAAAANSLQKFEKSASEFDAEGYKTEFESLRTKELELERLKSESEHSAKRRKEIEIEIDKLKKTEVQLARDKQEKERLDRLIETVAFIRNTLKSAAPRVAKNYVFHVSVEANTLYREITGNAEVTLKWTDDYGIELEQDGYDRPFVSLSGGEQMSAALAVRLALLRQLSDIRLAFFDEPTTNLDLERRERLAEQISRITENQTFDQLFVISHDDTFESYADHVLSIGE